MSDVPSAMSETSMTREEFLRRTSGTSDPWRPEDEGPEHTYNFAVTTTDYRFKNLMAYIRSHGIHGTFRCTKEAEDAGNTGEGGSSND